MRSKIVAGNWKMNKNGAETEALLAELSAKLPDTTAEVMVAPTFVNLVGAVRSLESSTIEVIAQNMHYAENGAFTGEISADMLLNVGVDTVLIGHSERRAYFGETDAILAKKVVAALAKNMRIIFCFGEELEDRKSDNHFNVVASQLKNALFSLEASAWKNIVLAYEPVWAIGTGETASPEQAQEMHAFIRKTITEAFDATIANNVSILYGGSVKPNNAVEIFSKPDVDGGLIGGAALVADDFVAIIKAI
ncbi:MULTISPECIES: triose-phosphate isomerase [Cellulophaga]|uniref:Triosephosphate isomerase n=1 Tax=Cellulophaga baltica 18 TaxID=1348584 RepID=A0AAU8R8I3_9FLAO|nr:MULTISPECIES: triose-phosphate isomerase [Cellulophaga]WFO15890.1 triose-phosphate isomerase [Cellulophaga baltica 4]AIZ40147.1 triosephosphate isomerase [Cellulophaga baltica 18]MBA6314433.1 triose-phosphate isomerase [Cellulophaga baltica]QXP53926.1 triose-phosphate isomerase [Cellulophaga sp. HaHa_2_1]QXP57491.1 triose-phosphate isomerase [Cellulophaga sp. HaHa_2_95]